MCVIMKDERLDLKQITVAERVIEMRDVEEGDGSREIPVDGTKNSINDTICWSPTAGPELCVPGRECRRS